MKFLLDTNVVSEARRQRPQANVVQWLRRTDQTALFISVLTLGELAMGVGMKTLRDAAAGAMLKQWLDATRQQFSDRIIGIDGEIAEAWGALAAARSLPVVDGLLAATAMVREMTLVTRNVRDMRGTRVSLVNPWE